MATLLKNQNDFVRTPSRVSGGSASLNTSEFLFCSNSPEAVDSADIADSGCWLNRVEGLKGVGQIYIWHTNETNGSINKTILVYNPNTYPIKISITHSGLTDLAKPGPEGAAWANYHKGIAQSPVTVSANGYGNLFPGAIANGHTYGILARINITKSDGSAITGTGVTLWDLAYRTNSGGATQFAIADAISTRRARGKGAGFYTTIYAPTLSPTNTNGVGFWIGANDDNFGGADCSMVTDYAPTNRVNTSGRFQGAYGQQLNIHLPIKNTFSTTKTFRIMIGTLANEGCPFAYFKGDSAYYNGLYPTNHYVDVIEVSIAGNQTTTVNFTTVIPSSTSTSYLVGARTV